MECAYKIFLINVPGVFSMKFNVLNKKKLIKGNGMKMLKHFSPLEFCDGPREFMLKVASKYYAMKAIVELKGKTLEDSTYNVTVKRYIKEK